MEKETGKRTDGRSRLNIGKTVKPVEKTFNRLSDRTDESREGVSRNQDILFAAFARSQKFNGVLCFERLGPGSVRICLVRIQPALPKWEMIFQKTLRSRQVMLGRTRSHQRQRKGEAVQESERETP